MRSCSDRRCHLAVCPRPGWMLDEARKMSGQAKIHVPAESGSCWSSVRLMDENRIQFDLDSCDFEIAVSEKVTGLVLMIGDVLVQQLQHAAVQSFARRLLPCQVALAPELS